MIEIPSMKAISISKKIFLIDKYNRTTRWSEQTVPLKMIIYNIFKWYLMTLSSIDCTFFFLSTSYNIILTIRN